MTYPFQHLSEPGAVTTGFYADDHIACELRIETTNVILLVMKFSAMDHAISRVAVTDSLLTSVEVHATIRPYRHLPRRSHAQSEFIATQVRVGGACFITSLPVPPNN